MRKYFIFIILLSLTRIGYSQPYQIDTVLSGLNSPVAFDFMPNGNIIFTEKTGKVRIFTSNNQQVSTFWDFSDSTFPYGEMGTLGIALDPNFSVNKFVYVYTTIGNASAFDLRVIRFTENNNAGRTPVVIFQYHAITESNVHASGNLHFRSDGKLYVSMGQAGSCGSQNLTCPRGKIHRINTDGSSPTNNPFYDDGNPNTGNDDRIWAYGVRNSFDFCFSPINDSIYATENTDVANDEINQIRKGQNYGYPFCQQYCNNPLYVDPIGLSLSPNVAVTGILIYNGTQMPELNGNLIYSSGATGNIFKCTLGHPPVYDTITSSSVLMSFPGQTPVTMKQGADGYIYLTLLTGSLVRIRHNTTGLSENGNTQPNDFSLEQNYPNPFNPSTNIKYQITKSSFVTLKIYDILGREVNSLVNENQLPGNYSVDWDGTNFPSGVYIYRLTSGDFTAEKKMVLIK